MTFNSDQRRREKILKNTEVKFSEPKHPHNLKSMTVTRESVFRAHFNRNHKPYFTPCNVPSGYKSWFKPSLQVFIARLLADRNSRINYEAAFLSVKGPN